MIVLRIIIAIYGLLTFLAIGEQVNADGFKIYHLLYIVFSTFLFLYVYNPNWKIYLLLGMISLIITAITTGYLTHTLDWVHILIRTIITVVIIIFSYKQ